MFHCTETHRRSHTHTHTNTHAHRHTHTRIATPKHTHTPMYLSVYDIMIRRKIRGIEKTESSMPSSKNWPPDDKRIHLIIQPQNINTESTTKSTGQDADKQVHKPNLKLLKSQPKGLKRSQYLSPANAGPRSPTFPI